MAVVPIDEAVLTWTGFPGQPGYSVLYAIPESGVLADIRDFFEAMKAAIPANVKISYPNSGRTVDATKGDQVGVWTGESYTATQCTASGPYAAPVGVCLNLLTDTLHRGKYIKGRLYVVPAASASFDTDGSLTTSGKAVWQTAADNLAAAASGNLVVWSRPNLSKPAAQQDGNRGRVVSITVPDKAIVLRSRRA